jgi:hypothetical protein
MLLLIGNSPMKLWTVLNDSRLRLTLEGKVRRKQPCHVS